MADTPDKPADPPEVERPPFAGLAARLAKETGDQKLVALVDLALAVDEESLQPKEAKPWITRGGRRLNAAERWLARADRWLRVWAHLAESEPATATKRGVLVMGYSGRVAGDGTAWVQVAVASLHPKKTVVASGWFVGPQAANARDAGLPSARLSAFREAAAELAGVGWAAVCWGTLGQAKPERCWHIDLPSGTRAAERAVEEGIAAAVNAALTYVRRAALARDGGPTRKRLDHHPRQLAVYLLHHGHGQLKRRGWRRTAMVLFNDETTPKTGLWVESKQARALRRDHTAACRRIGIAASSAGSVSVKAR